MRANDPVPTPPRGAREGGFTLIELMIASAVLMVGLLATASSVLTSQRVNIQSRETTRAVEGAKAAIERMRGEDVRTLFARYNDDENDDPDGPGTGPGASFDVAGLAGPGGTAAGTIAFTLDEPALGVDLNGDADRVDTLGNSILGLDYLVLPITVSVEWTGIAGRRRIEVVTRIAAQSF
jgi:prepilin-type N-terminal cleavage/methylation domain-containing protein